jgi:GNAT superfamily N-acetyltransferase
MDKPAPILVRPISEADSITEITDLLHQAYKVLGDMGLNYTAVSQDSKTTAERLGQGMSFVGVCNDKIIATITVRPPKATGGSPFLDRNNVASFGQFAVHPGYQRKGFGSVLIKRAEACARDWRADELALDTAESATHLIEYYSHRGYRYSSMYSGMGSLIEASFSVKPFGAMPDLPMNGEFVVYFHHHSLSLAHCDIR